MNRELRQEQKKLHLKINSLKTKEKYEKKFIKFYLVSLIFKIIHAKNLLHREFIKINRQFKFIVIIGRSFYKT